MSKFKQASYSGHGQIDGADPQTRIGLSPVRRLE